MQLGELARDTTLVPSTLDAEERRLRGDFITIRVRRIRAAAADPTDIPDADVPALRTQLASEIAQAAAASSSITTLVDADIAANRLLNLSSVDSRMRQKYITSTAATLRQVRTNLVRSIMWRGVASHPALLAPAQLSALHLMVDRRLRVVERMMYDVGRVERWERGWRVSDIVANPAGAWTDGWNRIFEYPRVPQRLGESGQRHQVFLGLCNPGPNTICQNAALAEWHRRGVEHLMLNDTMRVNPTVRPLWVRPRLNPPPFEFGLHSYAFFLATGADPVLAIESLFTPSNDYKNRNLLFCDHVIHVLHMESLLFARKKRSSDVSWLTGYIGSDQAAGRLRIHYPWRPDPFLAGRNEGGGFFEFARIHASELQIGDHLIIYNHPAYDKATVGGVWRLENALVVQVYPSLLLQGHGTNRLTLAQMKQSMIGLFNTEIGRRRQDVLNHLTAGTASTSINFGGAGTLVRRVDPASSQYIPAHQKADWWLQWPLDPEKDERNIATEASPARRDLARSVHKVEYDATHGFFPLWEPVRRSNGTPISNAAGKITRIQPVTVTAAMVAAWTWYLPVNPMDRDRLPVLRPQV